MNEDANAINKYRQQLMFLSNQKQQLQVQFNVLDSTLKELGNTAEKRVFKGVGNIFIMSDKDKVIEETKETKETIDLKLKNIQKQEDTVIAKINSLSKNESNNDKEEDSQNSEGIA